MSIANYVSSIGVRYTSRRTGVQLRENGTLARIEFINPGLRTWRFENFANTRQRRLTVYREFGREIAEWIAWINERYGDGTLGDDEAAHKAIHLYSRVGYSQYIPAHKFTDIVNHYLTTDSEVTECERCGGFYCYHTGHDVENDATCPSCYDDVSHCGCCNDEFFRTDDTPTTRVRRNRQWLESPICSGCEDRGTIPEDSEGHWYPYDELNQHRDGNWYLADEEPEEDDSELGVCKYHSSKSIRLDSSPIAIGLELEIRPFDSVDDDELARELKSKVEYLRCERDSSIRGFEVITGYGSLSKIESQAAAICATLQGKATGHDAGTNYGLHVTVSRTDSHVDENRMLLFWNDVGNERYLKAFTRRMPNDWCRKHSIRWMNVVNSNCVLSIDQVDKYRIINLEGKRLEIRWFRSTVKYNTLLACLRLAYYSWEFCRDTSIDTLDLTFTRFLQWCDEKAKTDSSYGSIRSYLTSKGVL